MAGASDYIVAPGKEARPVGHFVVRLGRLLEEETEDFIRKLSSSQPSGRRPQAAGSSMRPYPIWRADSGHPVILICIVSTLGLLVPALEVDKPADTAGHARRPPRIEQDTLAQVKLVIAVLAGREK